MAKKRSAPKVGGATGRRNWTLSYSERAPFRGLEAKRVPNFLLEAEKTPGIRRGQFFPPLVLPPPNDDTLSCTRSTEFGKNLAMAGAFSPRARARRDP